ncbi:MAG: recombination protein O N-terminal domain-containing protein [Myxococcales bacterium]|nr:recombination protein O N-terminal domain-containing protein [Myxococcales bacterium]
MSVFRARALVLRRAAFREHDLKVTLLLENDVCLEALAPSGQRSQRRFTAGLSPLCLYDLGWSESRAGARLEDAQCLQGWPGLSKRLGPQSAALACTGVIAAVAGPAPSQRVLFALLLELYETLSAPDADALAATVRFVFEALDVTGHGAVLDRCARCDRPAPAGVTVTLAADAGGVVCRSCGGGGFRMTASQRAALDALLRGAGGAIGPAHYDLAAALLGGVNAAAAEALARSRPLIVSDGA